MTPSEKPSSIPVSFVCADMSDNCLGRTLLLAELAADACPVKVVGVRRRDSLWGPSSSFRVPLSHRRIRNAAQYPLLARWLRRELAGTRVVVCKPRSTSLGLALLAGVAPGAMLLDVDDWDLGFRGQAPPGRLRRLGRAGNDLVSLFDPRKLGSHPAELALDRVARRFPHVLVSNRWLEQRFHGVLLPHVRDTDFLDPARVDPSAKLAELKMRERIWVGFIGTLRAHKGVEDSIAALERFAGADAPGLYLAGVNQADAYARSVVELANARLGEVRVRVVGEFPFSELPEWTALADVICLPSRDEPAAWGQIPAKLFDAMAMAKPVVASRANDIENVLGDGGLIVEPGDVDALAAALSRLSDARLRRELGARARARAVERYSYAAGRATLHRELARLPCFASRSSSSIQGATV